MNKKSEDKRPDYEGARGYALERLERELPPGIYYHTVVHTRDEVVPAAEQLALLEGVDEEDLLLLLTAACFHDLGYIEQCSDNEPIGARIAVEVLPDFGYSPEQVESIVDLIMATQLPQTPANQLEAILADADLYILGDKNFLARSYDLRNELASNGQASSEKQWYESQLRFLVTHHYHTATAQQLLKEGKQENIALLTDLLEQCCEEQGEPQGNAD